MDENMKKQADLDQASATVGETFPPLWRRLYENCIIEGFEEPKAFQLLCFYILSNGNITIRL